MDILLAPEFDYETAKSYVERNTWVVWVVCVVYLISLFGLKRYMQERKAFELKWPLVAWNLFLATFSTMGMLKTGEEFINAYNDLGFFGSYCKKAKHFEGDNGFWVWLFVLSKFFELGDSYWLVFRKRPLIFLQYYHHALTLIYAVYSYPAGLGLNRWGTWLNYVVHSVMYMYFLFRSLKIQMPPWISRSVTAIQIVQFIVCLGVIIHLSLVMIISKPNCDFSWSLTLSALFMYISYFVLFINFFRKAYLKGGKKQD